MPVERGVVETGGEGFGFGESCRVFDRLGGGFWAVGESDEVLKVRCSGSLSPLHDVGEFLHGVFEGAADGGVFRVGFGCHRFDVGVAEQEVCVSQ